jgi:predicted HAD superfamily Cof-like phosphohydrolase
MNTYQQLVQDFHLAMRLPIGDYAAPKILAPLRAQLRAELIREETTETLEAINRNDLPEIIDGLCDIQYVAYGAAVEAGIDLEGRAFTDSKSGHNWIEHSANMARASLVYDQPRREWVEDVRCDLRFLIRKCEVYAQLLGCDLDPFFREVHRTNMAKVGGPIRADGKRLKPEGWQPPRIREMLIERGWVPR